MGGPGEERLAECRRAERPQGRNRLNAAEGVVTGIRDHQCIHSIIADMHDQRGAPDRGPGRAAAGRPPGRAPKLRQAVEAGTCL